MEEQQSAMAPQPPLSRPIRRPWLLPLAVMLGAAGIVWFLATDAAVYLTYTAEKYTNYYWNRRGGLILHMSGGVLALTLGLIQIWLGLTARTGQLHRILGRIYVAAVLLGSCAAFYMAATIPPGEAVYQWGLVGLGAAWLSTTVIGYRHIRRGEVLRHRAWMIRSYAVTFGFVTLRLIVNAISGLGLMTEDAAGTPAAWLCWTVPLLLLEIGYRRWGWLPGMAGEPPVGATAP